MNTQISQMSKITSILICAIFLFVSPYVFAAIYSKSGVSINSVPVYGQLGSGHIEDKDFFTLTKCLNGVESFEGAPTGSAAFTAISTRDELKTKLKLTSNGSVTLKSFEFGGSSEFALDTQADSYSLVAIFDLRYLLKNEAFTPTSPVLNGIGEIAVANPSTFVDTCGTQFVSQRQIGGELYVAVRINFLSIQAKSTFQASANIALKSLLNLGASLTSSASLYKDILGITIFAYQVGGNTSAVGGILVDRNGDFPAANCGKNNLVACQNAINAIANYGANSIPGQIENPAPGTGPAILDYAFRDYTNVGVNVPLPPSQVSASVISARQQLADELEKNSLDLNRANQLQNENGPEIHLNFMNDVAVIVASINANIKILHDAGIACFDLPGDCLVIRDTAIAQLSYYDQNILLVGPRIPLHRYWNPGGGDHFYTTNFNELGGGGSGYGYEGIQGYVLRYDPTGTVPLYRYWSAGGSDHFYTTNWFELGNGGGTGYNFEGVQAYIYPNQVTNTLPLYRYWSPGGTDHFYTTNFNELGYGRSGYTYEGVQGYIFANWYN